MKQASNKPDCDNTAASLLTVDEAKQKILAAVSAVSGQEKLAIRTSLNRVLACDVQSTINVPAYDNSAMDGYAVIAADLADGHETRLELVGEAFAGRPFGGTVVSGQAVRIMTGAMIPSGTDTVIMQEQVERTDNHILIGNDHRKHENVRFAGEDMSVGQTILGKGQLIRPAELGVLASLGMAEVPVMRKLRVAFFSTGDELRSVGDTLQEGQIYDSNRYTLYGMLRRLHVDIIDMGVIPDQRDAVRSAFSEAAQIADAVITSGGVSVGEADYVKETLDELGEVTFWRVAMKPGKPMAIGHIDRAAFFGLPGNPVSAMVTFYQFVQPALLKMMGASPVFRTLLSLRCMNALKKSAGRLEYQRGMLDYDDNGQLVVRSTGVQGSHILSSMSQANCFIILPADNSGVKEGDIVQVQPFSDIL